MKHLKLFENKSQYDTYSQSIEAILPNVSYVAEDKLVYYNPFKSADIDYSKEYLHFEALEDGMTVSFKEASNDDNLIANSNILYYSTDKTTWKTLSPENENTEPINAGEKIYFKGNCVLSESGQGIGVFSVSKKYNAAGNVMSLLFADDFDGKIDLTGYDFIFMALFADFNAIVTGSESNLISAENLILPATTLANMCYFGMFMACTSLTTAPELPATTLANYCYYNMFYGCTGLTTAPELPATTLANYCYQGMFESCTSLTTAPELPATTLADGCYINMFSGCTGLTIAPELPVTTLADGCYADMFHDCSSLTTAPELPATTLADSCYYRMFFGCDNLTTAPELPATTLADSCYKWMFGGCYSLTTAPELPATTLANWCYQNMFYGCNNLNYIKILATDISASRCLYDWVNGVSPTGTFVKAEGVEIPTGTSGIPSGWTVQTV